jgi:hypothetical protein
MPEYFLFIKVLLVATTAILFASTATAFQVISWDGEIILRNSKLAKFCIIPSFIVLIDIDSIMDTKFRGMHFTTLYIFYLFCDIVSKVCEISYPTRHPGVGGHACEVSGRRQLPGLHLPGGHLLLQGHGVWANREKDDVSTYFALFCNWRI